MTDETEGIRRVMVSNINSQVESNDEDTERERFHSKGFKTSKPKTKVYTEGYWEKDVKGTDDSDRALTISTAWMQLEEDLNMGFGLDIKKMKIEEISYDPETESGKYRATGKYKDGKSFDLTFNFQTADEILTNMKWKKGRRNDAKPIKTVEEEFKKWEKNKKVKPPKVVNLRAGFMDQETTLKSVVVVEGGKHWILWHKPDSEWGEDWEYDLNPGDKTPLEDFKDVLPENVK